MQDALSRRNRSARTCRAMSHLAPYVSFNHTHRTLQLKLRLVGSFSPWRSLFPHIVMDSWRRKTYKYPPQALSRRSLDMLHLARLRAVAIDHMPTHFVRPPSD